MIIKNYSYETFPEYTEEVEGMIDVTGDVNNLRVRMQDFVYHPDGLKIRLLVPNTILDETLKYPLIIHVQGSGWYQQDLNDHIFDFVPIVKAGYCIAIVEYHYAPKHRFPSQIEDVKEAIRYLKNNYQNYPIDIDHVFLSGDSSGAHTALMVLFDYADDLLPLAGMLDFYGPVDFLTIDRGYSKHNLKNQNVYDLLGCSLEENRQLYYDASPINHLDKQMALPPILIMHGSKDHVVPFLQSVELYQKLKEYNYQVTFCKVAKADHGRSIFYTKPTYQVIINFLNQCQKESQ